MPKTVVIKYKCDRCPSEWYVDQVEGEKTPDPPSLSITYSTSDGADTVAFDALCESCRKAVEGYLSSLTKQLKGKSPARKNGAKKEAAVAAPSPSLAAQAKPTPPSSGTSSVERRSGQSPTTPQR